MLKNYLFLLLSLPVFFNINAQPILDASGLLKIGDIVVVQNCQPENTSPGNAGANQVWDFSQLLPKDSTFSTHYISPEGTPFQNIYPESNIAAYYFGNTYAYYHLTNNALEYYGQHDGASYANLTDPALFFKFPAFYGLSVADSTSGTFLINGFSGTVTGTVLFHVDGYGALSTPVGTFNDALRIRTVTAVKYEVPFVGQISDTTTNYSWYTPGYKSPLVEIIDNTSWSGGTQLNNDRSINYYLSLVSGTKDTETADDFVKIYPNPSKDYFYVEGTASAGRMTLYDLQGKLIIQRNVQVDERIALNGLQNGTYICYFEWKDGRKSFKKLEVQQ